MTDVHALTFNALTAALREINIFVPLHARETIAAAVEAAVEVAARADEREHVAREILEHKTGCTEHPQPLGKPSCPTCSRDAALHKAARVALGLPYPARLPEVREDEGP